MEKKEGLAATVLFFGFFALYVFTCAPHLAPYRDAGEMASLLGTLGVAHPPGYPLYTLIGSLFVRIPVGNLIYRANVFSAICAAGALALLFIALRRWISFLPAVAAAVFLGLSNPFWDLATVSEMYALGLLWFSLLLVVAFRWDEPVLFMFLMALGLGVRMDLLLLVPFFAAWFWWRGTRREIPWMALSFAAGASVFLYLMVRSKTDPLIDWGNPDTLLAVFNSARRKSYSGTLDLLSLSYRPGENFAANLKLYGAHIVASFGWWGVALVAMGVLGALRRQRSVALFFAALFAATGPLFLFLANMPLNPHSIAIVEASFLLPDVVIAIFLAFGLDWVKIPGALMLIPLLGVNAVHGYARASKRENLYARDYVENVYRSLPKDSIAVFHKDVQLFSLWASQLLEARRPDIAVVATGLSGSDWYWEMKRRWKTASAPEIAVKDAAGFKMMSQAAGARALIAGYDVDFTGAAGLEVVPSGLAMELVPSGTKRERRSTAVLPVLCLYRGDYHYGATPDFFSTDLIGDHARAHYQQGFFLMNNRQPVLADWFFRRAEAIDPTFARASGDRGYLAFTRGDLPEAYRLYAAASRKADRSVELASQYNSLPDVADGCRVEDAIMHTQWGAMAERLGRLDEARALYLQALDIKDNAQAHYNLAVTYWNRDWNQVLVHLRRAVELNPQMNEARMYLAKVEAMQGKR